MLFVKTLDLEPDPYPDPDSLEMLDPDPDSMNPDPQHWIPTVAQHLLAKNIRSGRHSILSICVAY